MSVIIPENYRNLLNSVEETEKAIKAVKDMFQANLSAQLALLRVTAPIVVLSGTGLNDDLNGVERPVTFPVKDMSERHAEVVHSLAKWKRLKLAEMGLPAGRGIYTDMNALRPDEELDNIHSIYVDQWDWERVIRKEDRTLDFLKKLLARKGKLVAVGTTSVRTLESLYYVGVSIIENGAPEDVTQWAPYTREYPYSTEEALQAIVSWLEKGRQSALKVGTRIIIVPGFQFRLVDVLVTNFHQPESTLILLVSAFVSGDWRTIYDYALANNYRVLSYGDSSLLFRRESE